jgi:hypothetical protein
MAPVHSLESLAARCVCIRLVKLLKAQCPFRREILAIVIAGGRRDPSLKVGMVGRDGPHLATEKRAATGECDFRVLEGVHQRDSVEPPPEPPQLTSGATDPASGV